MNKETKELKGIKKYSVFRYDILGPMKTLTDHTEAWGRENNMTVPPRNSKE